MRPRALCVLHVRQYTCALTPAMGDDLIPRFSSIPSGRYTMGAAEGREDERPAHEVRVDAFHVSRHAVTVGQYALFLQETGHPPPALRDLPMVVTPAIELAFRELAAPHVWRKGEAPKDRGTHPVTRWSPTPTRWPIAGG